MNNLSVLIIDDEQTQVANLQRAILQDFPEGVSVFSAFEESDILQKIEYCYYDLAIVDLRMSDYSINGFQIIEKIKDINPYAKIIIVSAYGEEYQSELNKVLLLGNILGFVNKSTFSIFRNNIKDLINIRIEEINSCKDVSINALRDYYSSLKNETDPRKKGMAFEYFISMLFGQMGFKKILYRVKDRTPNEIDLAIRNELNDPFFNKFSPYFLVECKNYPENGVDKNVFIVFKEKIKNSNGLSNFGILITTGYMKSSVFQEAMRSSCEDIKIILLSNPEIEFLIRSDNKLEDFKSIIDRQIKDN
ncbi:response regulator [Bacteroides fragilis]|uniref:response regulator n=1 Tax=Bacteroides fragilis TaxID=817 RepID=UPI002164A9E6|nr:response regulator [Bacteroides fragilis]MCS2887057.1 response regulator [Bacteroides fragilis]UVR33147.1 response regulator [Bacteroides fragilis]UVS03560.1 response regulator [Bacteroides fragilis]